MRHFGGAAAESEALSLEQFDDLVRAKVGRDLKAARVHAGLTQAQLAKKLRRAQTTVSKSEAGKIQVSEAYIRQVLKVCGLNEDFSAS